MHADSLTAAARLSGVLDGSDGLREQGIDPLVQVLSTHRRTVLYTAGHYFVTCACGYVSTGFVAERDALMSGCEIEALLADSAIRRARWQVGDER